MAGADAADGILLDLGVSSLQIDEAERGFSYAQDAPLDMRMNPEDPTSAADILRDADEAELTRILRVYGEERFACAHRGGDRAPPRHGAHHAQRRAR